MQLVIVESSGRYSWSAFIIKLNKKEPQGPSIEGLSSPVLKLFITAYKVITQAQLLVYVQIPVAGAGGINKLWQIPCIYNHLPAKPTKPQFINRRKHSGTKWSKGEWLTGCYLARVICGYELPSYQYSEGHSHGVSTKGTKPAGVGKSSPDILLSSTFLS